MRSRIPWARPRHELLLLALVAFVALTPVYGLNAQDVSRLCLTQALVHGRLSNDACLERHVDKASFGGRLYSDKAPGMSVLEIPAAEALQLRPIGDSGSPGPRLWGVRLLASGLAFLVCTFLVGRVSEGLVPGAGGATLVAFGAGTLISGLAASNFSHLVAAALGFGAFLLAWRRRPALAGLAAGLAVLVEYQSAAVAAILAIYVLARGRREAASFLAGAVPGLALLLAYDTLAFGSPWHLSYRYVANGYTADQSQGLFGIGLPHLYSAYEVFSGSEGLLVVSPVIVAGVWGLVLLGRRHRAEALVCASVATFYVVMNCSYFLPYGGVSPGPRFLAPALPFLALGFAPSLEWRPRIVAPLAVVSVIGTTALMLHWSSNVPLRGSICGELFRLVVDGRSSRFARSLTPTALGWVGVGRIWAASLVGLAALAAVLLALRVVVSRPSRAGRRLALAVATSLFLVCAATASAVGGYPYGTRIPASIRPKRSTPASLGAHAGAAITPAGRRDVFRKAGYDQHR